VRAGGSDVVHGAPQGIGREAGDALRAVLTGLLPEYAEIVIRVLPKARLSVGAQRIPDARRQMRLVGASGGPPRRFD
jgi:hypothetical protein